MQKFSSNLGGSIPGEQTLALPVDYRHTYFANNRQNNKGRRK